MSANNMNVNANANANVNATMPGAPQPVPQAMPQPLPVAQHGAPLRAYEERHAAHGGLPAPGSPWAIRLAIKDWLDAAGVSLEQANTRLTPDHRSEPGAPVYPRIRTAGVLGLGTATYVFDNETEDRLGGDTLGQVHAARHRGQGHGNVATELLHSGPGRAADDAARPSCFAHLSEHYSLAEVAFLEDPVWRVGSVWERFEADLFFWTDHL